MTRKRTTDKTKAQTQMDGAGWEAEKEEEGVFKAEAVKRWTLRATVRQRPA
jgi:hypothetical protein